MFVYFTNTRLLLAKIYINVVVYKTKFHERFYFGIYFDLFCAFATPCQHNNSVASNFMIKNPIF